MEPVEKLLEKKPITHVIIAVEADRIGHVREKLEKLGCRVNSIGEAFTPPL